MIVRALIVLPVTMIFAQGPAAAASVERGKVAFMQHGCWQCHGTVGQGSIATSGGKRLAPDPLPWETFSSFVRSSNRAMPPYSDKILTERDLEDIHAYLQSISKPPDAKDNSAAQSLAIARFRIDARKPRDRLDHGAGVGLALSRDVVGAAVRDR